MNEDGCWGTISGLLWENIAMNRMNRLIFLLVLFGFPAVNVQARETISIQFDPSDPLVAFAVENLKVSLENAEYLVHEGNADFYVKFDFFSEGMGPQSFRIQREGVMRLLQGPSD